jgi:hypothetical protein
MSENPSPEPLAEATHVDAADGGGTVESPALTLAELNTFLGSDFKDTSTALQSLKETKNFVGKRKEDIAAEVKASLITTMQPDESLKSDVQSLKNELFYTQNPQYKGYEGLLSKLGSNPAEAVSSPEFQQVFEKAKVADEITQNKSVVSSNSRLSQPSAPVIEQAVNVANARGTTQEDVAMVFAQAINKEARGE